MTDKNANTDTSGATLTRSAVNYVKLRFGRNDGSSKNYRRILTKSVILVVLFSAVYVFRPIFHPIIYRVAYSPGGLYAVGIPLFVAVVLYLYPPIGDTFIDSLATKLTILGVAIGIGVLLMVTLGVFGGMLEERNLANQAMDDVNYTDELPETYANNTRVLPRHAADEMATADFDRPTHQLTDSDVARGPHGNLTWSYGIAPEQLQNRISSNQTGVELTNMGSMTREEQQFEVDNGFDIGERMILHRGAEWNLLKEDYWVTYKDDPYGFVVEDNNGTQTPYMAYPQTGHEWHNMLTIDVPGIGFSIPIPTGIPYTTPTWEGIAVIDPDGNIDNYGPDEARNVGELDGQRIYPLYNSERLIESLEYREGIQNQLPIIGSFENIVEPADVDAGTDNKQPFTVDLLQEDNTPRMSYVYALSPPGEGEAVTEVWTVNAETGELRSTETDATSPNNALRSVEGGDADVPHESLEATSAAAFDRSELNAIEPIPVFSDGKIWWQFKIVIDDDDDPGADVISTVFIDDNADQKVEYPSGTEELLRADVANGRIGEQFDPFDIEEIRDEFDDEFIETIEDIQEMDTDVEDVIELLELLQELQQTEDE